MRDWCSSTVVSTGSVVVVSEEVFCFSWSQYSTNLINLVLVLLLTVIGVPECVGRWVARITLSNWNSVFRCVQRYWGFTLSGPCRISDQRSRQYLIGCFHSKAMGPQHHVLQSISHHTIHCEFWQYDFASNIIRPSVCRSNRQWVNFISQESTPTSTANSNH